MFKTNQVLVSSCVNLWRSCHCGKIITGLTRTSRMFSSAPGLHKLLLLSASRCSSLYFHGSKKQNGEFSLNVIIKFNLITHEQRSVLLVELSKICWTEFTSSSLHFFEKRLKYY